MAPRHRRRWRGVCNSGLKLSRPSAAERLVRLLAIVPWVVARDGPLISEVCERFEISERELVADLNMLFLCGVYPYTPDALIEVDFDGGRVWVRFADWFRRPLRLTAREGLALVAAARATLDLPMASQGTISTEVPGGTPNSVRATSLPGRNSLESALSKLETVLGGGSGEAVEIELGVAPHEVMALLQSAVEQHRKVKIDYYSFGRDEASERVVHPWRVFSSEGHWYLLAWCESAVGRRLFRVDRVRSAEVLDAVFGPPSDAGPLSTYEPRPEDPEVVLDLAPAARWVAAQYPNEGSADLGDGRVRVHLRVSSKAWLERLLLRAGPDASVVSGAEGVAENAARRLLAVYTST